MCAILEEWLPKALSTDAFPTPPIIEKAHCLGRHLTAGSDPKPTAVIVKFLNYREKEKVMCAGDRKQYCLRTTMSGFTQTIQGSHTDNTTQPVLLINEDNIYIYRVVSE